MHGNNRYSDTIQRQNSLSSRQNISVTTNYRNNIEGNIYQSMKYENEGSTHSPVRSRGSINSDLQSTSLTRNSSGTYIYDQIHDKNTIKKMLADDYRSKIEEKSRSKQNQKEKEKAIEKLLISNTEKQASAMLEEKLKNQSSERQLQRDEYRRSIELKRMVKEAKEEEKSKWREKQEKQVSNDKRAFFKQFYNNYDQESQLKDRIYTEQVSPLVRKREAEKEKFSVPMQRGGLEKYLLIQEELMKQKEAQRQEHKQTLKTQIDEKSERVKRNRSENKLAPPPFLYSPSYHHPIINPVSLTINPENKYLVSQVRQSVDQAYSNMSNSTPESSGLSSAREYHARRDSSPLQRGFSNMARNGSQVLL